MNLQRLETTCLNNDNSTTNVTVIIDTDARSTLDTIALGVYENPTQVDDFFAAATAAADATCSANAIMLAAINFDPHEYINQEYYRFIHRQPIQKLPLESEGTQAGWKYGVEHHQAF